ncbi:lysophospholipid acyltransferase family protein [Roseomonas elaeocarpi]|uniref:Lysophospholipid acyltransferase family protein n=1 Tax=Roseomonas elaeocarpi TaxID=907779 RepID=A0ABV6JYH1_9PROT
MIALRSAVFNAIFLFAMAVFPWVGLLLPRRLVRPFVAGWARWIIRCMAVICGMRLRVTGMENLPQGPAILASKHQSAFDTFVWLTLLPHPVYIMKQELLRLPGWGALARRFGSVGVDRAGGGAALKSMVRQSREFAERDGAQLVIFPEGTRTAPGERVTWQPGVAALASATGLPVVPVATDSGLLWGRRAFSKRPGTITLAILPPLPAGLPRATLMQRLENEVEEASARLIRGRATPCG